MKKTILVFLASIALVLLACSPELPTAGSTPVDIRAPAEPASISQPIGSPGKLDSCPAAGVWIHRHVCSANGNTGLQYPIAHTDGDHTDIGGNGNAC